MKKLRAYFISDYDETEGVAFVAKNSKEAKKKAFNNDCLQDIEWIDLRVKWIRDANIEGLIEGEVDCMDGLKRNIYSYVDDNCPICGSPGNIYNEDGKIGCNDCLYPDE